MSSDRSGFLVSAAIVAVGLGGLWAFPTLQQEGLQGMLARLSAFAGQERSGSDGITGVPRPEPAISVERSISGQAAAQPSILVPASAPDIEPLCDPRRSGDVAVVGDRIQLRFFERSALAAMAEPDGTATASDIVFERLDLSGTYDINATGSASLPAIGHVDLAGQGLACIEGLIARAAYDTMGIQTTITAAFAVRPPVLVRGAVRAPGSYSHSPGLTIERVLAQAGELDSSDPASQSRLIALQARRSDLERSRAAWALERMRVSAMIKGQRTLSEDVLLPEMLHLLGADRVSEEERILVGMLDAWERHIATAREAAADLNDRIDIARRQQNLAQQQLNQYNARLAQQTQRLRNLQVRDLRLEDTTIRAVDSEGILLEKQDLLLRLEADRRQAELEAALSASSRDRDLMLDLRRLDAAIASAENELNAILAELRLLDQDASGLVVTVTAAGGSPVVAEPDTPVRPGDLVTVTVTHRPTPDDLPVGLGPFQPAPMPQDNQSAWIR